MLEIKEVGISDIFASPNFEALRDEYIEEGKVHGMPDPEVKEATYLAIEGSGVMTSYAAYVDGVLAGFAVFLAPVIPHYGVSVVTVESLFVAKEHRSTGAGLRLIKMIENFARSVGAPGLLMSSPFKGDLGRVLPRLGYHQTHEVYFKGVSDAGE